MKEEKIIFIEDSRVDSLLNNKLIKLLSISFPDQPIFLKQRFFKEMPRYRWYIEDGDELVAHVALHEKTINVDVQKLRIGGIAEVCVHPDYRKKGLAKKVLNGADDWMIMRGYKFSMLFGDTNVYASSGYFSIDNKIIYVDYKTNQIKIEKNIDAMVKQLSDKPWPTGYVNLNGPTF